MSEFTPQTPNGPDEQQFFELLSRRHDGDLGADECRLLATLDANRREAAERFLRQAELLSGLLKEIPVSSLERPLFETPTKIEPHATRISDSIIVPRRSGSQRVVVGTVTSLLCAGLLFALFQQTETGNSTLLTNAERLHETMEVRSGNPSISDGNSLELNAGILADAVPSQVADVSPNVSMSANVVASKDSEVIAQDSSVSSIQPLIQSDDWNVVVVRINGNDRDQAMDQIQSIVRKAGLHLKGSSGHDESQWLGVVLTSDVVGREDVVNAMEGVGASKGAVSASPSSDSQEALFIAAARESLKHPTRSELHHGKVFVVLPSSTDMPGEEQNLVAVKETVAAENPEANISAPIEGPAFAAKPSTKESSAAKSAKISARGVPAVTLVVFEFSEGEKSGPNSSGQQI
jgi:hypothetical protein